MASPDAPARIGELLRTANLRATPQRVALLAALERAARPVSVEALVRGARGAFDVTTAYRALEAFEKRGLARSLEIGQGRVFFERAGDHHHHAICTSCGVMRDISLCIAPSLDASVRKVARFARIDRHALEFYGVCVSCAKRTKNRA